MNIIQPSATIIDDLDGQAILKKIENAARTCYQSFDKAGKGTAEKLIASCIKRGHESIMEHVSVSVWFITDRAIHNELVRHRITSVSCESTRYCKYENGIAVISPLFQNDSFGIKNYYWEKAMKQSEESYCQMIARGATPQEARAVLPMSLKCEYVVTANLREWRYIFRLRCNSASHPEMQRIMIPLMGDFKERIPVVFDDIEAKA